MNVLVLGTGPSAVLARDYKVDLVATVNAGLDLCPNPDWYGVFENDAAVHHAEDMADMSIHGATVFSRPQAALRADAELRRRDHPVQETGAIRIGLDFGPLSLRRLHIDTDHQGMGSTWMSSGVLMLWLAAHLLRPRKIIAALDGYPPPGEQVYAEGVSPPPPSSDNHLRPAAWYEAMNDTMARAIGMITRFYSRTEFYLVRKPRHARKDWAVKYLRA